MKLDAAWLQRIRLWWTAGFTLLFLLNMDQFGTATGLGPVPKYWSVGVFLATFALFLPGLKPGQLLRKPIFWWSIGYLLVSMLWVGPAYDLEAAKDGFMLVVTTCLYVWTALLAYSRMDQSNRMWDAVLWVALLLATASILLEYFNPAVYVFAEAGQGIPGRAAGLYLNPNAAAQALVMILAWLMMRGFPKANLVAVMLALVAMFLTFSRGGLVALAILTVAATIRGRLPRWFMLVLAAFAALVVLAGPLLLDVLSIWVSSENKNSLDRLAWLLGQGGLNDYSAGEREYLVKFSWQQFLESPLLGHGLGYTWVWSENQGSHNLVLRHLVEYGFVGAFIFPIYLIASIRSGPAGAERGWLRIVAIIALLLGLFSHNMLEQTGFLLPWLAMCLMSRAADAKTPKRLSP